MTIREINQNHRGGWGVCGKSYSEDGQRYFVEMYTSEYRHGEAFTTCIYTYRKIRRGEWEYVGVEC